MYVGVDVFGRNCYGGGGYNTYKVKYLQHQTKLTLPHIFIRL